jgi:hypothetical protein
MYSTENAANDDGKAFEFSGWEGGRSPEDAPTKSMCMAFEGDWVIIFFRGVEGTLRASNLWRFVYPRPTTAPSDGGWNPDRLSTRGAPKLCSMILTQVTCGLCVGGVQTARLES